MIVNLLIIIIFIIFVIALKNCYSVLEKEGPSLKRSFFCLIVGFLSGIFLMTGIKGTIIIIITNLYEILGMPVPTEFLLFLKFYNQSNKLIVKSCTEFIKAIFKSGE